MKWAVVARRELGAYARSPVAYLVATLFLVVQGYAYWLFVSLLNQRAAPLAFPLRYFFGGSFLFWLFIMFLSSVVTMRLLAEERRLGTIEPLLTAPVSAAEIVLGKYAGALAFYACLWAPTVTYVALLARLAPAGQSMPLGPVAAGYLGTLLVGASALAVGLLASTVTQHQLLAVVLGFLALLLLLLVGAAADAVSPGSTAHAVLDRLSLFRQMEDFGRGIVDTRPFAYHLGLALCALFAAARFVEWRGLAPSARVRAVCEIAVLLVVALLLNVLAGRHYRRYDWTGTRANTLSPRTDELLARLPAPFVAHVLMLPTGDPDDVYAPTHDLLELYAARAPHGRFTVDTIDPDRDADRLRAMAEQFALSGDELEAGAVVIERQPAPGAPASSARARFIGRPDLAETEPDADGRPHLKAFQGELAFDAAIVALSSEKATGICFTRGHGELRIDSLAVDGMSDWAEALKRSNATVRTLDAIEPELPASCDVTVVAGPERPFAPSEIAALDGLLRRGGRLMVLLGPALDPQALRVARVGIEPLLERWGVRAVDAVALDPAVAMSAQALAWAVDEGYADHPVVRGLVGRRTVWALARPLVATPLAPAASSLAPRARAIELVKTSDQGFGAVDTATLLHAPESLGYDEKRDVKGPLAVAVAVGDEASRSGPRLVVLGSKAIARNDHDVYFNRDLLESSVRWLAGEGAGAPLDVAPRTVSQLRLALDEGQLSRVFWICVVGLPLVVVLLGCGVWWRRRA